MRRAAFAAALVLAASFMPAQAQSTGAHDAAAFWRAFDDAALNELIATALDASSDIAAASARVNGARSARAQAAFDLAPAVTAAGGYNRQRRASAEVPGGPVRPPELSMWDAGVQLNWEIDVFGSGRRALAARNELLSASEHDRRSVEIAVVAEIADSWFELQSLLDRRAVALQNAENQRRTLSLTQTRLDAGRGTALDTERAQAQLSSTLAAVPLLDAAIVAAQHRLAVVIGRRLEGGAATTFAAAAIDLADVIVPDAETIVMARPDVQAAAARVAAGSAGVGAARASYLPRFSVAATAGYTATDLDGLGRNGPARYAVGPMISWPLLDLGRVRAGVDVARAEHTRLAAQHRHAVLAAHAEIGTTHTMYDAARARITHLADASDASVRATAIARLRYEEGTTDFLEVLDAERRQLEAQERLAAGRADAAAVLVALYRATGGALSVRRD